MPAILAVQSLVSLLVGCRISAEDLFDTYAIIIMNLSCSSLLPHISFGGEKNSICTDLEGRLGDGDHGAPQVLQSHETARGRGFSTSGRVHMRKGAELGGMPGSEFKGYDPKPCCVQR